MKTPEGCGVGPVVVVTEAFSSVCAGVVDFEKLKIDADAPAGAELVKLGCEIDVVCVTVVSAVVWLSLGPVEGKKGLAVGKSDVGCCGVTAWLGSAGFWIANGDEVAENGFGAAANGAEVLLGRPPPENTEEGCPAGGMGPCV